MIAFPKEIPTLDGKAIKLIPLEERHAERLFEIAEGKNIWEWYPYDFTNLAAMKAQIKKAMLEFKAGNELPFVIVEKSSGLIVGTTRFFNASWENRRVEIGYTWIGPKWQGTVVNKESKYLLFKFAFETLKLLRVELKTDSRNIPSQKAMQKLGLVQEGVFRQHMVTYLGVKRDTIYFSVIDVDWPDMKAKLELQISQQIG